MSVPLRYDREIVRFDSAVFDGSRISHWTFRSIIADTIAGTVKMFATSHSVPASQEPLPPGAGPPGHLFFTVSPAAPPGTIIDVDTTTMDLSPFSLAGTEGSTFVPRVVPGEIRIGGMTGVFDEPDGEIVPSLGLINYPNPFNSETVLLVNGISRDDIRLTIYNILGQPVCDLSDRVEIAGYPARTVWDGTDDSGRSLGSGMYFAICHMGEQRIAQKIILLR